MPNPATITDLESRWRPLSVDEQVVAQSMLDDAWALLLGRLPGLEDNLTAGTIAEANARRVVTAVVLRFLKNPDGKSEERIDDYSYRRSDIVASGEMDATERELLDLTPNAASRRVRSVRLVKDGNV